MHAYKFACMYVQMYAHVYVGMYKFTYLCIRAYVHSYIPTFKQKFMCTQNVCILYTEQDLGKNINLEIDVNGVVSNMNESCHLSISHVAGHL